METKSYGMLLEAVSPIAHHESNDGNQSIAMRRKVRQPDGSWARVPYITGDSLRHGLREAAAYAFLDAAGLLDEKALSEAATRLLFSGGMITGRGDGAVVNMDRYRELCSLCPPLALLGGCTDNRSVPGRLFVDEATLVCEENRRYLPEWALDWLKEQGTSELDSHRAMMEEVQRVRMDPMLDPGKRALMLPDAQVEVSKRLTDGEVAHATDDAIARDASKSTMMPRRFERLAVGSLFYWRVTCHCMTPLDVDTFHVMVAAYASRMLVGGKRSTGHGQMRVVASRELVVSRPSEDIKAVDVTDLGPRIGQLFVEHVRANREQIVTWLRTVNA